LTEVRDIKHTEAN